MSETTPTSISLITTDGRRIGLTADQADQLLQEHPELRRELRKWQTITAAPGTLCVIDEQIVQDALDKFGLDR